MDSETVQAIVASVLSAIGSPVVLLIVKHWVDSYKGRVKKRRTEVEKALEELNKAEERIEALEQKLERCKESRYTARERFARLRLAAINHGLDAEFLPVWPEQ